MDIDSTEETLARLADRVGPSVVGIGRGWGVGSGVVIGPGRVLTTAHAVRGDEAAVAFADGRRETAVAALDQDHGVAVLTVDTGDLDPIGWATDDVRVAIGTPVVALANPGGRGLRATVGHASSAERSFRGPRGRRLAAIEHTAPMPRGSSGAPLLAVDGRLLGVNAVRLDGGLILAVPADGAMRRRVELLARGEQPAPRRLGLAVAPPRAARRMRRAVGLPERSGLLVRAVEAGGPAERAGVEPGDLLATAGERELDGVDVLHQTLDALAPGGTLSMSVVRGADEREVTIEFNHAGAEAAQE